MLMREMTAAGADQGQQRLRVQMTGQQRGPAVRRTGRRSPARPPSATGLSPTSIAKTPALTKVRKNSARLTEPMVVRGSGAGAHQRGGHHRAPATAAHRIDEAAHQPGAWRHGAAPRGGAWMVRKILLTDIQPHQQQIDRDRLDGGGRVDAGDHPGAGDRADHARHQQPQEQALPTLPSLGCEEMPTPVVKTRRCAPPRWPRPGWSHRWPAEAGGGDAVGRAERRRRPSAPAGRPPPRSRRRGSRASRR